MRLFLVCILLHKSHEKDEKNGSSCDTYNDGDDHVYSTNESYDNDVTIANCNLSNNLIVDAGNKIIKIGINISE